ncbi:hypothetical protein Tco_0919662 [Tanacetum coccineum]
MLLSSSFKLLPRSSDSSPIGNIVGISSCSISYWKVKKTIVEASRNNSANSVLGSYVFAVKKGPLNSVKEKEMQPALVLDDSCYLNRDFSLSLMGKVKEFSSLSNLKLVLATEGFNNVNIKYIGGSWFSSLQVSDSFHVDERVAWIDIEGVPIIAWVVEAPSEDPFHIYDVLNKKHENDIGGVRSQTSDTLKYPLGFTPRDTSKINSNHDHPVNARENMSTQEDVESNKATKIPKEDGEVSACSGHFQKATKLRLQGSFLQFMEHLVKVGHTMGYKMEGCIKNIEEIIESQGVHEVNR